MGFLDLIKKEETKQIIQEIKPILKEVGPGKGKKLCDCGIYVGARTKVCNSCGYDFETKTPSLFANIKENKDLIKSLGITNQNLIQWILMCSYLYYCRNVTIIEDKEFDQLIQIAKDNWQILEHRHKSLIQESTLENGSLYYLKENDYPQIIRHSALRLYKATKKFKKNIDDVVKLKLDNLVAFNEVIW